jgi:hypothetical protein
MFMDGTLMFPGFRDTRSLTTTPDDPDPWGS